MEYSSPWITRNLAEVSKNSFERSAYYNFLNMKTRIDTSFKVDVRNKYASLCEQPGFEIICTEMIW